MRALLAAVALVGCVTEASTAVDLDPCPVPAEPSGHVVQPSTPSTPGTSSAPRKRDPVSDGPGWDDP